MDVNARLIALSKQQKLSQVELSRILDVSPSFVSQVFSGKKSISLEMIMRFCENRGIPLYEYFNERTPPARVNSHPQPDLLEGLTQTQVTLIKQLIDHIRIAKSYNDRICYMPLQGYGAAGTPIFSPEQGDFIVPVPEKYLDGRFFVVAARGDSMIPQINDGDFVVVQKDSPGERGDIVLARIDGLAENEYMIKRVFPRGQSIEFRSINTSYSPVVYRSESVLSIDKVVYVIHKSDGGNSI